MKTQEYFRLELPKWPAMVVVGKPVTMEQAAEIIVRTSDPECSCNDHLFSNSAQGILFDLDPEECALYTYGAVEDVIRKKLGISDKSNWKDVVVYKAAKQNELGILDLEYLANSRICSSWIGGPHGWCDWEGNIGCSNYNIGKYPTVENIYDEWSLIAKTFPFLELKCQLFNHEAGEEESVYKSEAVIEFHVEDGKVTMHYPKEILKMPQFNYEGSLAFSRGGELGCTLETLKWAVKCVIERRAVEFMHPSSF